MTIKYLWATIEKACFAVTDVTMVKWTDLTLTFAAQSPNGLGPTAMTQQMLKTPMFNE